MGEKMTLEQVIRRAYLLGQTYWQQADSESYSQNKKADKTEERFNILLQEALATHTQTVDAEIELLRVGTERNLLHAQMAESRLAAVNTLLREALPRIGAEYAESFADDLVERIQAHLSEPRP